MTKEVKATAIKLNYFSLKQQNLKIEKHANQNMVVMEKIMICRTKLYPDKF